PAISLRRSALENLLKTTGRSLRAIQDSINDTKESIAFEIPSANIEMSTEIEKVMAKTSNIVGYLEGSMKDEVVVIGAHMDHVGYGGEGSGSLMPDTHEIHNGADDNASGTAALMELAQAMSAGRSHLRRTMVFVAFSGEELGLLGAAHYVNHPSLPITSTTAMLNMDMVGRLKDNSLTVYGTGSSPVWPDFVKKHNKDTAGAEAFTIKSVPDGFGPSDHAQFYGKDIPVLFFFTGTHNDYHKPSDDWEKLNYEGQEKITRMIYAMALDLSTMERRPEFVRTPTSAPMAGGGGDSRGFAVTLGVVPDYGETSDGMKIGGLRPNGPAEKAGLKPGDVIVKMSGKNVLNIYDYMGILGELKAGDEVEVIVKRDGAPLTFKAVMGKRQ
ncbi:MAG: M28 family peptidase, partial [Bacteroidota bacterium]